MVLTPEKVDYIRSSGKSRQVLAASVRASLIRNLFLVNGLVLVNGFIRTGRRPPVGNSGRRRVRRTFKIKININSVPKLLFALNLKTSLGARSFVYYGGDV
jgi:hypothetical protein